MSPDEFLLALHTIETLPPEISRDAENLIGTVGIADVLPELIRRSREHLAAEASGDEVEAAVNAMLRSESWSCFFSREDCTAIARAALTAAKIKTAEAVAAEREACAQIAATAFGQWHEVEIHAGQLLPGGRVEATFFWPVEFGGLRLSSKIEIRFPVTVTGSSPIPPERVPEALRELADLMVPVRKLQERILAAAGPPIFDHPQRLRDRASRLEAELAKGGAR